MAGIANGAPPHPVTATAPAGSEGVRATPDGRAYRLSTVEAGEPDRVDDAHLVR